MIYTYTNPEQTIVSNGVSWSGLASALPEGTSIAPYVAPPVLAPTSLSMKQARLALLAAGHLATVTTIMATLPQEAQIIWEFSNEVDRSDPLTAQLATALNLSNTDLDALFTAGSKL